MVALRRWSRAEEDQVIALIKLCKAVRQLKQVHAHILLHGQSQNSYLAAKLVRSFTELGCLQSARSIADEMTNPNAFVWTALIRGYSQYDEPEFQFKEVFSLYRRMRRCSPSIEPLTFTVSSVLKACARASALSEGMQVHANAFKHGFQFDASVQTALIGFYGKCRRMPDAQQVFDKMQAAGVRDIHACNTAIAGYAEAGDMESARYLFDRMPQWNTFTLVEMIQGYAAIGQMEYAQGLFETNLSPGDHNAVVCTAIICGYSKCGDITSARSVFDKMTDRDVASWNAMITAYTHSDHPDDALDLFQAMLNSNTKPNKATIATIASACAQLGSRNTARALQHYVDHHGSELMNRHTVAALVDLHAKCGDLQKAREVFDRWPHRDLICYSSMIAGFGIHGHGEEAMRVFDDLISAGLKPDSVVFVSVLTACSHAGMVEEGRRYFEAMKKEHEIAPSMEHYMCMVDMLGRAGLVEEARRLIAEEMCRRGVRPSAGVWGALLSGCRSHGEVEVGEEAARRLMEMEPENAGNYVLLSNIYARAGRWEGVAKVRAMMRGRGMKKPPGWSSAEVGDGGRRFVIGEVCDTEVERMMDLLAWELMVEGYLSEFVELE
ncbi:TPR-like protein [Dioscorea alata]|uniref:TPR-like protein n=1 Tax=Dioscorea alata TaxID=55571 RepID=A0ACB7UTD1_DIOAL|nr:TPR-like protein [Dioscorea alata]